MFGIFGKKKKEETPKQEVAIEPQPEPVREQKPEQELLPQSQPQEADFSELLTKNNLKVTSARLAVLETLKKESKPVDAQFLIQQLQEILGVDRVTIFRILNVLAEKDVITKLEFGEGKARYELNIEDHHHLICEKCGKIDDVAQCPMTSYQEEVAKTKNFTIKRHSLAFYGLCEACRG